MDDTTNKEKEQGTPAGSYGQSSETKPTSADTPKKRRKSVTDELKKSIEEQKQIAQDNYEKFLRVYAELENYKKRVEKDRTESLRYANEGLLRDLLPFIDNLERAINHASAEKNKNPEALVEGIELTLKDLVGVLEKHGLRPIESVGNHFDPNLHEAMMQVESDVYEPQTIVEEFQKGYLVKDRLLRPARVSVATRPEPRREGDVEEEGQPSAPNDGASE
jgi:molecular chaperone GrpE